MEKIAIIGGGIVGSTAAYFLSQKKDLNVCLFDNGNGQATKAAAGIISPWLSKRRNQRWFNLSTRGAELVKQIAKETNMGDRIYNNSGTIITRKNPNDLKELYDLSKQREKNNTQMGNVELLTSKEIQQKIPYLSKSYPGILIPGGARIDGELYCNHLQKIALENNLVKVNQKVKIKECNKIVYNQQEFEFDKIIVCAGAWINECFTESDIKFDVYPQKGQLIETKINKIDNLDLNKIPVLMPEGNYDVINNYSNHLFVGATHENEECFDLNISNKASAKMLKQINELSSIYNNEILNEKVGTRAYTKDFAPFFGKIPNHQDILVASGLGSSGLTTGPMIGKLLSDIITHNENFNLDYYTKSLNEYMVN